MKYPRRKTACILLLTFVIVYFYRTLLMLGVAREGLPQVSRENDNTPPASGAAPKPCNYPRLNTVVTEYDVATARRLRSLVERKANSRDPEMISLIRDLIEPPSQHILKTVSHIVGTPQSREADSLLNKKTKGFYIECGALDGERSSNTLFFEHKRQWDGLLIEMDPYYYTQLRGKSRRAYSINACLSPFDYPLELDFQEATGGAGTLNIPSNKTTGRIGNSVRATGPKVPCFPLESILLALNRTRVDYFSLDVEGFELDILKTVPFDSVHFSVFSVEYAHGRSGKQSYRTFMESKGYDVHKDIQYHDIKLTLYVEDFIFAKQKTP